MWVSTETIYQSLYVQSRGALRRELTAHLRTGRVLRSPSRKPAFQGRPKDTSSFSSARPPWWLISQCAQVPPNPLPRGSRKIIQSSR
jgi:hypothetical protein